MKAQTKNIGIKVAPPKDSCDDNKCPFHGKIKTRGRIFTGEVVSKDLNKTATVKWTRKHFIPKYERSETRKTKIRVHNPPCINAKINDTVRIIETKPLSKTKGFVIIECIKKEKKTTKKEAKSKKEAPK
jgi:small subunit ribosomal protein S17